MKKRLLAILLALTLVVSLMPVGVFADWRGEGRWDYDSYPGWGDETDPAGFDEGQTVKSGNTVKNSSNGVTVNKTLTEDGDGYTITMEAYAENSVDVVTSSLDIVLVLDTSGSMGDNISGGEAGYVSTGHRSFSYSELDSWFTTYYYFDGTEYYEVRTRNDGGWGVFEDPKYYAYYVDDSGVKHDLNERPTDSQYKTIYTGVLYTWSDGSMTKMEAMKDAVEEFITSVADNAEENNADH